jgi:hypothetical protein
LSYSREPSNCSTTQKTGIIKPGGAHSRAKHKHYKANPSHHNEKGRDSYKSHSSVINSGLE